MENEDDDCTPEILEGFDDFTIASSWERLIIDVEETCRNWQSAGSKSLLAAGATLVQGCKNVYQVEKELSTVSKGYRIELFFQLDSREGSIDEWGFSTHIMQLWFGVQDFLVITPISMSGVILDAPEATLLLSAMAIALSNCESYWPAFVRVHDPTRKAYKGFQGMRGPYSRSFEADRIGSRVPVKFMHLEGLYDLFVSKVGFSLPDWPSMLSTIKIGFTMKLTYRTPVLISEYMQNDEDRSPAADTPVPVDDDDAAANVDVSPKSQWDAHLPWGAWYSSDDPVKGFELVVIWRNRLVNSSVEMAEFENAATFDADIWLLEPFIETPWNGGDSEEQVNFASRLGAIVTAFLLAKEAQFMDDFVAADKPNIKQIASAFSVPSPGVLDRTLKELFHEGPAMKYQKRKSTHQHSRAIKGAPPDSLFSQFCLQSLWFGTCNIRAIAVLWIEFIREVRWCWDELQPLPRILIDDPPDLDSCLIHQKLQLLGACIRRKAGENQIRLKFREKENGTAVKEVDDEDEDEDEEEEDLSTHHAELHINSKAQSNGSVNSRCSIQEDSSSTNKQQRRGSLGPVDDLMLLNVPRRLHAPIIQEPPLMTEDMMLEREEVIAALSISPSDETIRTRVQSNILAADMSAFKAANPGSVLEDFIRWYSPRDWIDKEDRDKGDSQNLESRMRWPPVGRISRRMSEPGNAWNELWINAPPLPASEQKPIFDCTREGEKVIHYLETLKPHQLLVQMLSTAFAAAADILYQTETGKLQNLEMEIDKLYLTIAAILKPLRNMNFPDENVEGMEDWQDDLTSLCALFEKVEMHVILAAALNQRLSKISQLYTSIFNESCTNVHNDGKIRKFTQHVAMRDRDTVATLFPPLNSVEIWKKSLSMGNFLNGHEPFKREIIFSHFEHYFEGERERYKTEYVHPPKQLLSHRMYIEGGANDLQVAFSVISDD